MIVKLTLILANDKFVHIRDDADKEMLEQVMQKQYQEAFNVLVGPKEKAIVKKCELVKEV
jgi:dihydroorotase